MEDIFQILIFVAFAVLSFIPQLVKGKKGKDAQSPPLSSEEEWEETFDDWEEKEIKPEPVVKQTAMPKKKTFEPVKMPPKHSVEISSPKLRKKIKLSSKEEAKKAFIYSEIFNRKYT